MVRCRLDGNQGNPELRYVPAAEYDLWRHFMVNKYVRAVEVEDFSVWVPEKAEVFDDGMDVDHLLPVVRIHFEKQGPQGTRIPVTRYLPAETFPAAKAALLAHYDARCRWGVEVTPGYFVSSPDTLRESEESLDADADRSTTSSS